VGGARPSLGSPVPGREGVRTRFGKGINTRARPLVFVARGSHASCPIPCRRVECPDSPSILDVPFPTPSSEKRHNGGRPWGRNKGETASACALPPTRDGGRVRSRWNAFSWRWGSPTCVLGLCKIRTGTNPPASRVPGSLRGAVVRQLGDLVHEWEARRKRGDCDRFRYSSDELRKGERLLALGDSFSSGHGAGDYDDGTTTGNGNTCVRSTRAWPELVAERLDQLSMRPLAVQRCTDHACHREPGQGELERQAEPGEPHQARLDSHAEDDHPDHRRKRRGARARPRHVHRPELLGPVRPALRRQARDGRPEGRGAVAGPLRGPPGSRVGGASRRSRVAASLPRAEAGRRGVGVRRVGRDLRDPRGATSTTRPAS
jgi:hypothetical protein